MFKTQDFSSAREANNYADHQHTVAHVNLEADWVNGKVFYRVFVTDEALQANSRYQQGARIFLG